MKRTYVVDHTGEGVGAQGARSVGIGVGLFESWINLCRGRYLLSHVCKDYLYFVSMAFVASGGLSIWW